MTINQHIHIQHIKDTYQTLLQQFHTLTLPTFSFFHTSPSTHTNQSLDSSSSQSQQHHVHFNKSTIIIGLTSVTIVVGGAIWWIKHRRNNVRSYDNLTLLSLCLSLLLLFMLNISLCGHVVCMCS